MDLGLFVCSVGVDMGLVVVDLKFGGGARLWVGRNSSLVDLNC